MRWLKRTCSRHASVACAALQSAKACRLESYAAGRIAVATCLSTLNSKQPCARPTPDIPIPSRLKKLRDTFSSSSLRSGALNPDVGSRHSRQGPNRSNIEHRTMQKAQVTSWLRDYCLIGFPERFGAKTLGPLN